MVVEDDRVMVSLLTMLLQMDGFEVMEPEPGTSIAEQALTGRPDLVLMDVIMARADGIAILDQLRSKPDLASLRVIMTSGMDVEEKCRQHGADAFLLKPYSPDQLIQTIRAKLEAEGGGFAAPAPLGES
jgi:CheY-like chemotaxis protein